MAIIYFFYLRNKNYLFLIFKNGNHLFPCTIIWPYILRNPCSYIKLQLAFDYPKLNKCLRVGG